VYRSSTLTNTIKNNKLCLIAESFGIVVSIEKEDDSSIKFQFLEESSAIRMAKYVQQLQVLAPGDAPMMKKRDCTLGLICKLVETAPLDQDLIHEVEQGATRYLYIDKIGCGVTTQEVIPRFFE
jgi:hypothetical protein